MVQQFFQTSAVEIHAVREVQCFYVRRFLGQNFFQGSRRYTGVRHFDRRGPFFRKETCAHFSDGVQIIEKYRKHTTEPIDRCFLFILVCACCKFVSCLFLNGIDKLKYFISIYGTKKKR